VFENLINYLPGVSSPTKRLTFKDRLKWTGLVLLMFLVLGQIKVFGVKEEALARFGILEQIMASTMGSLITLGIGPIVTASIILQLLVGSGIISWNLQSEEGRARFQGTQKLLAILFCIFEAYAYVAFGAIPAKSATLMPIVIAQIAFGGFIILLMDEVVSKWGIGSGISLFIAAGVTKRIFVSALNPLVPTGSELPSGLIPQFISYLGLGLIKNAVLTLLPILATILVFVIVVYVQDIKVEIPLAFGSFSGFGRRWPLKFIYTSNIPVILTAALLANLHMIGSMTAKTVHEGVRCGILGCVNSNGTFTSGVLYYLSAPRGVPQIQIFFLVFATVVFLGILSSVFLVKKKYKEIIVTSIILGFLLALFIDMFFVGLPDVTSVIRALTYLLFMMIGATIFSVFWVETSGMDAHSVAEQIKSIGMQVPGFRRDPRIVEKVLSRYIMPLAVMGALFVGLVAALADFTGALGTGTGILLTVMIIYNFYEQISMRYMEDMNPMVRKFFEK